MKYSLITQDCILLSSVISGWKHWGWGESLLILVHRCKTVSVLWLQTQHTCLSNNILSKECWNLDTCHTNAFHLTQQGKTLQKKILMLETPNVWFVICSRLCALNWLFSYGKVCIGLSTALCLDSLIIISTYLQAVISQKGKPKTSQYQKYQGIKPMFLASIKQCSHLLNNKQLLLEQLLLHPGSEWLLETFICKLESCFLCMHAKSL